VAGTLALVDAVTLDVVPGFRVLDVVDAVVMATAAVDAAVTAADVVTGAVTGTALPVLGAVVVAEPVADGLAEEVDPVGPGALTLPVLTDGAAAGAVTLTGRSFVYP